MPIFNSGSVEPFRIRALSRFYSDASRPCTSGGLAMTKNTSVSKEGGTLWVIMEEREQGFEVHIYSGQI